MAPSDNCENSVGGEESIAPNSKKRTPLQISTSKRSLVSDNSSEKDSTSSYSSLPKRLKFLKFNSLDSPSAKFQRISEQRDEVSRSVPSSTSVLIRERFNRLFSKKIDFNSLKRMCKEWIRDPLNIALFIWMLVVAVSGAILFMVMTGMLNRALPKKSDRDVWFEVNNQILNALFTLMCLYQHPKRIYHFALLLRWRPEDIPKLRKVYCKNGTYKPHEWRHMMVVVFLLNLNCFAQYCLCGLNLGYRRSERPAIGVGITISVAIGAPAVAGIYSMLSPLGKDYETETDEEAQTQVPIVAEDSVRSDQSRRMSFQKRFSFALRDDGRTVETRPQWSGSILDFWDDISLAYLSLFCSFCVFGWNMERLGFGNMYVHIATFLLFCMAPFWIFSLAAVNIDNETVREVLAVTGVFLCIFGLLYGGFWRIQMRKRYNLPPYKFCCGKPAVTDFALWLFCCFCSLSQEVRTGNAYDIVEDKFCRKKEEPSTTMLPLNREDGEFELRSHTSSPFGNSPSPSRNVKSNSSPSPTRFSREYNSPGRLLPLVEEESSRQGKDDETMVPPTPSVITRDEV